MTKDSPFKWFKTSPEIIRLGIVTMFRMASMRGEIEIEGPFKQALEGLLDLAVMAQR